MKKLLTNHVLIILGWFFVALGLIGVVLPILPTTPFMILATALFAKSSPRFHQMLLSNRWFGEILRDWEERGVLSRKIKYRATILIAITFTISITLLYGHLVLQLMLLAIALILLFFLWRIKEDIEQQRAQSSAEKH
ncbi:MAG: YbaN family protein [Ghiorsea sp.]|nr:YbaN family protein [Ghiorsea sp.]